MPSPAPDTIAEEILRQTAARGAGKSISPEDVAQALGGPEWRPLLGPVRQVALALLREGRLHILRKGKPVPPEEVRGVIRFAAPGDAA